MTRKRTIQIEVDENIAARIEELSRKSFEATVYSLIREYANDRRRTLIPTKTLSVRFPVDWWEVLVNRWGAYGISPEVRKLIFADLNTPKTPLTQPPVWKERERDTGRSGPGYEQSGSVLKRITVPLDWYERMQDLYGAGVTTYVKSLLYRNLNTESTRLSIPRNLSRFL